MTSRRISRFSLAVTMFLTSFVIVLVMRPLSADFITTTDNIAMLLAAALSSTTTTGAAIRSTGRNRVGWVFLSIGSVSWTLGQLVCSYYEVLRHVPAPYPSFADYGFDLAPYWFCAGIATWVSPRGRMRTKIVCDGLIVATALTEVVVATLLGGHLFQGDRLLTRIVSTAYPVGEIILVTITLLLVANTAPSRRSGPFILLLGLLGLIVADLSYDYLQLSDSYHTGIITDVGWPLCFCLIAVASRRDSDMTAELRIADTLSLRQLVVPYTSLVSAIAVIGWCALLSNTSTTEWVLFVVLSLSITLRQFITILENRTLTRSLEASRDQLTESEFRYRSVIETIDEAVFRLDRSGKIVFLNGSWERITGYTTSESLDNNLLDYFSDADQELVRRRLFDGVEYEGALRPVHLLVEGGEHRLVEFTAVANDHIDPPGFVGSIKDVSLRNKLESELRFSQKLESVGRLAAGVAHELNTPMQVICDNLLFLTDVSAVVGNVDSRAIHISEENQQFLAEEVPSAITDAYDAARHAAHIVQAMLVSADVTQQHERPIDLNAMLVDLVTMMQTDIDDVAEIRLELGDIMPLSCDGAAINRAFANILLNAIQAMRDSGRRGIMQMKTVQDAENIVVSIADNGVGIPYAIQDKVFDPFYTTRPVGNGAGLGLAVAREVITSRNGRIWLDSTPDQGTTVWATLPLHKASSATGMPAAIYSVLGS